MIWIEPYKKPRKYKQCQECYYWQSSKAGWGNCLHPKCNTNSYLYKGKIFKHTNARYKTNTACKNRFIEKETT